MRRAMVCVLLAAVTLGTWARAEEPSDQTAAASSEVRSESEPTAPRARPYVGRPTYVTPSPVAPAVVPAPSAGEPVATRRQSATKARSYREYVALGDSWSADVVIADAHGLPDDTHAPIDCVQSHVNYPKLVAAALRVPTFRDATCGSATTDHFANPQAGLPLGGTNPPQFDRLTKKTDLITVGIGGNDSGFAAAAVSCLSVSPVGIPLSLPLPDLGVPFVSLDTPPTGACKERFTRGGTDVIAERIRASEPKLVAAFKRIHQLSPKARILAVNYLAGIPERGCWPLVPFTDPDMRYLYERFHELNAMVARAAASGGAELVDTYTPSIGHHVCAPPNQRYVEGLGVLSLNDLAIAVPAHPNAAGARAQAAAVLSFLRS